MKIAFSSPSPIGMGEGIEGAHSYPRPLFAGEGRVRVRIAKVLSKEETKIEISSRKGRQDGFEEI